VTRKKEENKEEIDVLNSEPHHEEEVKHDYTLSSIWNKSVDLLQKGTE